MRSNAGTFRSLTRYEDQMLRAVMPRTAASDDRAKDATTTTQPVPAALFATIGQLVAAQGGAR